MNHSSKVHKFEHANESLISVNGVRATIDNISTSDVETQLQPEQNAQRLKKIFLNLWSKVIHAYSRCH
ncbi:hypothetical protein AB3S75_020888 [Citrus x aurantiifolia]